MKVTGTIGSVLQGVSQQPPHNRQPGQHAEVVNMIPDPVIGLARRQGSKNKCDVTLPGYSVSASKLALAATDLEAFRTFEYSNANKDYVLFVRKAAYTQGSELPPAYCFNKTDMLYIPTVFQGTGLGANLYSGGCSAITAIGRYVYMAGNTIISGGGTSKPWAAADNQRLGAVWIKVGAYSRTYKITCKHTNGSTSWFAYTTPSSAYPEILDTSNIPVYAVDPAGGSDTTNEGLYIKDDPNTVYGIALLTYAQWAPSSLAVKNGQLAMTNVYPGYPTTNMQYRWVVGEPVYFPASMIGNTAITATYSHIKVIANPVYQQMVADATNDYNSKVTQWIIAAAKAVSPENIAKKLQEAAFAHTGGYINPLIKGSTLFFSESVDITVEDGGDGSYIQAVCNEVNSISDLSPRHYRGKIVKISAKDSDDALYMEAKVRDPAYTGIADVYWVEAAGEVHSVAGILVLGTVHNNTFYVGAPEWIAQQTGLTVPTYSTSHVGDSLSSPMPYFVGRKITYLGVFQDRLLIGAGAVIRASKIGDYLNFFRTSVVTVPSDDAMEFLSQGVDDDVLRHSVMFNKDLVLFGDKRQYIISGSTALTPTSADMAVMSSHAKAPDTPPVSTGGLIIYGYNGADKSSVHQIQPGRVADSPESFNISSQIKTYIVGQVAEILPLPAPSTLVVRTKTSHSSLWLFSYLDKMQQGRVQDAWHRWDFAPQLGLILGISYVPDGLLVFFLRKGYNLAGEEVLRFVCDMVPTEAGLTSTAHLDSQRLLDELLLTQPALAAQVDSGWKVVFSNATQYHLVGDNLEKHQQLRADYPYASYPMAGVEFNSIFVPTNPFVKGQDGQVVPSGMLTVASIKVECSDTVAFTATVSTEDEQTVSDFDALMVGKANTKVGLVPISTGAYNVPVLYDSDEYTLELRSNTWMPFTITSLGWVGQWFNRPRSV